MPAWVVLLIVAWSVARRRQFWWVLAIPVIALLAVNAYAGGWAANPVDAIVDGTGHLLGVPASRVLDPFSPRFRSPFDDTVDIIAGVVTLWIVDAVFGALSRQGRPEPTTYDER